MTDKTEAAQPAQPETLDEQALDAAVGGALGATSSSTTLTSTSSTLDGKKLNSAAVCPC